MQSNIEPLSLSVTKIYFINKPLFETVISMNTPGYYASIKNVAYSKFEHNNWSHIFVSSRYQCWVAECDKYVAFLKYDSFSYR